MKNTNYQTSKHLSISDSLISILLTIILIQPVFGENLKIDFTRLDGKVYSGWDGYFAQHEQLSSFVTQTYYVFGTTINITASWKSGAVDSAAQLYDRDGNDGTDAEDLLRDWIGTDARVTGDPMTLTIEGLPPGNYKWKSYHHDNHDQTGLFDVTLQDASGSKVTKDIDISSTQSDGITNLEDVTTFTTDIISNGIDPVTLTFDCQSSTGSVSTVFFVMNGFELKAENLVSNTAFCPVPANNANSVPVSVELLWQAPTEYTPSAYDIYLGLEPNAYDNPVTRIYSNSFQPELELLYDTNYTWIVDSFDNEEKYPGVQWSFRTFNPADISDVVEGNMMLINDNGGWCWYQDEKIIYDPVGGNVITSTAARPEGFGGKNGERTNDVDATTFNIATGKRTRVLACNRAGDDHNMGALWIRPDGRYLHLYAEHYSPDLTYFRVTINPNDGSEWGPEQSYNWLTISGLSSNQSLSYTNVHYLASEGIGYGRLYNIVREFGRNPNISYSDDWGQTWQYAGRLSEPLGNATYSNYYHKFKSNGVDRIDFIASEQHPRNYNNGVYHGYIKNGKTYNSYGVEMDNTIFDQDAPTTEDFTPIFLPDIFQDPNTYHTAWTNELELDSEGYPVCLFQTRYGTDRWGSGGGQATIGAADHRFFYARFDGSIWTYTELCKLGTGLHAPEQDYTGMGCIHPNDANTIYVSTPFDPNGNEWLGHHEIFKGVTSDYGLTWDWTQITKNSTVDNIRPAIPVWDSNHIAVFWTRGVYPGQERYDMVVVGMVDVPEVQLDLVTYIDANEINTTLADDSYFIHTDPNDLLDMPDNMWHEFTDYGNEGSFYTAGEFSEDAPGLKTSITDLEDGTYDVFAYFWSDPSEDYGLLAGFESDDMLCFSKQSSQYAQPSQFINDVDVIEPEAILYRVYIGRKQVIEGQTIDVYIDDYDPSYTNAPTRTTYDGIGIARVISVDEESDI